MIGIGNKGNSRRNKPAPALKKAQGAGATAHAKKGEPINWSIFWVKVVAFTLLMFWMLLWARFYFLQVIQGPEYAARAERQHNVVEVVNGKRGSIFDRNGNVLASSVESYSVYARMPEVKDVDGTSAVLAAILNTPQASIKKRFEGSTGFVWVKRKVSDKLAVQIIEAKLTGIYLQKEYARFYPYGHLAGQLIGFVNSDHKGGDGLEASFENVLQGKDLKRLIQRDARGNRLYMDGGAEASELAGQDIRLTIDVQVQYFAESSVAAAVKEYDAKWGGCLVVDVKSGDILAWAHYPSFNPNTYSTTPEFVRRNKMALDALEQGSTIKPFVVAAALQEKLITPQSTFDCENGSWKFKGATIRDTRPHKALDVEKILRYSSNIGAAKIGLELGGQLYGTYLQRLGFGSRTGLPLIGESPGIMRAPGKWPDLDTASSAFGQSFSATGLQMAQAYLCLANNGQKKPLQLIMEQNFRQEATGERIFSETVANTTQEMLKSVVQSQDGGGRQARIPGIEAGGKTGTAQKASKGTYGEKRVASFAGFAPVDLPQFVAVVIVDEPKKNPYGGTVAAPVFRNVMSKTFAYNGILPDLDKLAADMTPLLSDPASYAKAMAAQDALARSRQRVPGLANVPGFSAPQGEEIRRDVRTDLSGKNLTETVPDVSGLSVRQAVEIFTSSGFVPLIKGQGTNVVRQEPNAGSAWPKKPYAHCILWTDGGNENGGE